MDILLVLEGATYAAFIAGAIFAVIELRSMSKDRETDFLMRMNEYWTSRDFMEVNLKVKELPETEDPREIENKVGKLDLYRYVEYLDGVAMLVQNKSLKLSFALNLAEWFNLWEKLEPWILCEQQKGRGVFAGGFQWLVEEDSKWFLRNLSRSELDS